MEGRASPKSRVRACLTSEKPRKAWEGQGGQGEKGEPGPETSLGPDEGDASGPVKA